MGQTAYLGFLGGRAEAYLDVLGPRWAGEYGGAGLEIGMNHVVLVPLTSPRRRYHWEPVPFGAGQERRRRWTSTVRFTAREKESLLAWIKTTGRHIVRKRWVHPRHKQHAFEWRLRDGKVRINFVWTHEMGRNKTPLPPDVLAEKLCEMKT